MSRDRVLSRIKKNIAGNGVQLPDYHPRKQSEAELVELFTRRVEASGADYLCLEEGQSLNRVISDRFPEENVIYSEVETISHKNLDLNTITTPSQLENVDLAILNGITGVAENGAIWITDQQAKFRSVWFLTQRLVMVIEKRNIVPDMTSAYLAITPLKPGFGCFISGPSKTADIEQSLVIGAHGARSLTVILI